VRINEVGNVITNWSQGGKVIHNPKIELAGNIIESISGEAKKAARAFHSRLMGVDVMLDKVGNTPKVIELQSFTGFPDIRKFNMARYLVDSGFFE
jgi:D-alanine-D-alanine ligase-like ATP-grasp enzyme